MTDVNDEELSALFRAAASDSGAPPPGFDRESVLRASRRVTIRRRAAAAALGVALFAGVGLGVSATLPRGDSSPVAAPMLAPDDARAQRDVPLPSAPGDARAQQGVPPPAAEGAPGAGSAPEAPGIAGPPLGPGTRECADRQDPALRTLVEQVLPEVVGAPEAAITMECRPGGERGVNVEVADGAARGLLTVQYLPPGVAPRLVEGALSTPTASGGTVVVSSRPERPGEAAPLADRLPAALAYLAPRL
jgi:hypothetical protein